MKENIRKRHTKEEITQFEKGLKERIIKGNLKVYCILRHVSRSGMSRNIDFYTIIDNEIYYLTYWIGVVLDYPISNKSGLSDNGLVVGGCGMDMGFSVVYNLSRKLFKDDDEFKEVQKETGYTKDAGYKIKYQWI